MSWEDAFWQRLAGALGKEASVPSLRDHPNSGGWLGDLRDATEGQNLSLTDNTSLKEALKNKEVEDTFSSIVAEVRELLRWIKRTQREPLGRPRRKVHGEVSKPVVPPTIYSAADREWKDTVSAVCANRAAGMEAVITFRQHHLGGRVLTEDEKQAVLLSPALCLLSTAQVRAMGLSLTGHYSSLLAADEEDGLLSWPIRGVKLSGASPDAPMATESVRIFSAESGRTVTRGPEQPVGYWTETVFETREAVALGDGWQREVPIFQGSFFAELLLVQEALLMELPWLDEDALEFVITGVAPEVGVMWVKHERRIGFDIPFIHIIAAARVSHEAVQRLYTVEQKRALESQKGSQTGTMRLVRFVEGQRATNAQITWSELRQRWNDDNPNDRYAFENNMTEAYQRAVRRLGLPAAWHGTRRRLSRED